MRDPKEVLKDIKSLIDKRGRMAKLENEMGGMKMFQSDVENIVCSLEKILEAYK